MPVENTQEYPNDKPDTIHHAMHILAGLQEHLHYNQFNSEWCNSDNNGRLGLMVLLGRIAERVNFEYLELITEVSVPDGESLSDQFDSFFEFDVDEAIGTWFVDHYLLYKKAPTLAQAKVKIDDLIKSYMVGEELDQS